MKEQNTGRRSAGGNSRSITSIHLGGVGLCVFCAAITFIGTSSAVDALNRNHANTMSMSPPMTYISADDTAGDTAGTSNPVASDDVSKKDDSAYDYTTDQLDWAHRYHISWDSAGNPIDENGNVMNDPTTSENEVVRAIKNGSANEDGVSNDFLKSQAPVDEGTFDESSVDTQTVNPDLYQGVDGVSKISDGSYVYTVQNGDCVERIASRIGVPASKIFEANGLTSDDYIYAGQQLKLPADGVVDSASGAGLG